VIQKIASWWSILIPTMQLQMKIKMSASFGKPLGEGDMSFEKWRGQYNSKSIEPCDAVMERELM